MVSGRSKLLVSAPVPTENPRKSHGRRLPRQKAAQGPSLAVEPLERCHQRWAWLFFGVLDAVRNHDPALSDGLFLAFEKAELAAWDGDLQTFIPGALDLNPSDDVLRKADRFRKAGAIPDLRGRRKSGQLRPPYDSILLTYYRFLWEERKRSRRAGEQSASDCALSLTAKRFDYTSGACKKHLEKAQDRRPDLVKLWKGKGAQWIEVDPGRIPPRSDPPRVAM
jgi:hypothetical protein